MCVSHPVLKSTTSAVTQQEQNWVTDVNAQKKIKYRKKSEVTILVIVKIKWLQPSICSLGDYQSIYMTYLSDD